MRIKEARLQNGISQKELATAIGVAQNTLSQYENGKREADYDTILKISEILNCPIDYLIRGEDGENHINRIAELREERNLSQQELALIIGVTPNAVSNWENGDQNPDYGSLKKMAYFFNCSTDYLLGRAPLGRTFVFDEQTDPSLDWAGRPRIDEQQKKPTPVSGDGLDPELVALIKRIPADRMPEVERYLRFQAEHEETP